MAHNPYELMMSMAIDDLLDEEEHTELFNHLEDCDTCSKLWDQISFVDVLLTKPVEAIPPVDFSAKVMNRVEAYENGQKWYPWLVGLLATVSLIAALWLTLPVVFISLGTQGLLVDLPIIGDLISAGQNGLAVIRPGVDFAFDMVISWFRYLVNEPAALAVVLSALVLASTWIGLLEGMKGMRTATALATSQQSA